MANELKRYLMISLKIGKAICPVCNVNNSNSFSSVSSKLTTLGLFLLKIKIKESGNWIVVFFKEKITLKHFEILGHQSRESAFKGALSGLRQFLKALKAL